MCCHLLSLDVLDSDYSWTYHIMQPWIPLQFNGPLKENVKNINFYVCTHIHAEDIYDQSTIISILK